MQSNTVAANASFGAALNYNGNGAINFLQGQQQQHLILNQQQHIQVVPSPQQSTKDTTFTKVFVGGLPYHTTDETLKLFFQKFGNIEEAVVITDRSTGKSRGYGFVTMETKESADSAILDPNPVIDGRKANVNLAYLGVKARIAQPTNFIPLTIRYPMPAQTTPYGFHPFYYHPASTTGAPQAQATYLGANGSHQNLLLAQQSNQNMNGGGGGANNNPIGLFDLSSQTGYNTAQQHINNGFNSNRLSPFDPSSLQQQQTVANQTPFFSFNAANLTTSLNNQAAALNSVLKQAANNSSNGGGSYFALPQHLSTAFQTQLQDRL